MTHLRGMGVNLPPSQSNVPPPLDGDADDAGIGKVMPPIPGAGRKRPGGKNKGKRPSTKPSAKPPAFGVGDGSRNPFSKSKRSGFSFPPKR